MASLARLFGVSKSLSSQFVNNSIRTRSQFVKNSIRTQSFLKNVPTRAISTSKKAPYDVILDEPIQTPPSHIMKQPRKETKDWQSYGFDEEDEVTDLNDYHNAMFLTWSVIFVGIIFYWTYFPDYLEADWTQREAYLLMREREAAGLPYVSPDYVDPATIKLPSDEELEGIPVII